MNIDISEEQKKFLINVLNHKSAYKPYGIPGVWDAYMEDLLNKLTSNDPNERSKENL